MNFLLSPAFFSYECLLDFFYESRAGEEVVVPSAAEQVFINYDSASQVSFPSFSASHSDLSRWGPRMLLSQMAPSSLC